MNRPPRRVAVTAPPQPGARSRPVPARPVPQTVLDEGRAQHARTVRRAQLRRVAVTLTCGALLLIGLPVLLQAAPGLAGWRVGGLPLSWAVVAWLPYPLLALLAWWHLRGAERAEQAVQAEQPGQEPGQEPGEPPAPPQ